MADQSATSDEIRLADSASAITGLLEQIDAGEVEATPSQRAYLVGARDTMTALAGATATPHTTA